MQTLGSTGSKHARARARAAACPPQDPNFVRPVRFAAYRTAKSRVLHKNPLLLLAPVLALLSLAFTTGIAQAAEESEPKVLLESLPELTNPRGVVFDPGPGVYANRVLVAEGNEETPDEVKIFSAGGGKPLGTLEQPPGGFAFTYNRSVGLAVDGAGNLYVSNTAHHVVDKFGPDGKYVCQYSGQGRGCLPSPEIELGSPSTFEAVVGLAVDQAGDLYVADSRHDAVDEFDAGGGDITQVHTTEYPMLGSAEPMGLAVDGAGDEIFIEAETSERNVVELQRAGGAVVAEVSVASEVTGMSFVGAGLLLSESHQVVDYDPAAGVVLPEPRLPTTVTKELYGGVAEAGGGSTTGNIFVVNGEKPAGSVSSVDVFGVPPLLAPGVSGEFVSGVTAGSAVLQATVAPRFRATHYLFQWGADRSYGGGVVPAAPGGVISGNSATGSANATLTGLTPGTTYHYRVLATNKAGTTFGPDMTFTTFLAPEAGLPDGRVWEMVSPLDKHGGNIDEREVNAARAAADGDGIVYDSPAAFAGAESNVTANSYLAHRDPSKGWVTESLLPPVKTGSFVLSTGPFKVFSPDLSRGLMIDGEPEPGQPPVRNPPLPGSGAPPGYINYYLRDSDTGAFQALMTQADTPAAFPNPATFYMAVEGVTPDLDHVVVALSAFVPKDPIDLDEWSGGELIPVNVPVNPVTPGETVPRAVLGSDWNTERENTENSSPHTISSDGSRVFWSGRGEPDQVFVREGVNTPRATTVALPAGEFVDASTSGELVLLSTGEVYDLEPGHERELANVTAGAGGFEGELGASENLSSIYFADTAILPGSGANAFGHTARAGANNVYLYRQGAAPLFIAALEDTTNEELVNGTTDIATWARGLQARMALTSGEGGNLVFRSRAGLTGYDNRDANTGEPDAEIYKYTASGSGPGALVCISCNPTGEAPVGSATLPAAHASVLHGDVPGAYYQLRALSSDGSRVFFESPEALVPQDKNDTTDVYEYEGGRARLISGGTGGPSSFIDASETGDDVFFTTAAQLVPGDTDSLVDLYDARVGGGLPAAPAAQACTGGGCQGVPAPPPLFATPAGATAQGVGNFGPAPAVSNVGGSKPPTRAQKLANALRACRKDRRHAKRAACERSARRRYGPITKSGRKGAR